MSRLGRDRTQIAGGLTPAHGGVVASLIGLVRSRSFITAPSCARTCAHCAATDADSAIALTFDRSERGLLDSYVATGAVSAFSVTGAVRLRRRTSRTESAAPPMTAMGSHNVTRMAPTKPSWKTWVKNAVSSART